MFEDIFLVYANSFLWSRFSASWLVVADVFMNGASLSELLGQTDPSFMYLLGHMALVDDSG